MVVNHVLFQMSSDIFWVEIPLSNLFAGNASLEILWYICFQVFFRSDFSFRFLLKILSSFFGGEKIRYSESESEFFRFRFRHLNLNFSDRFRHLNLNFSDRFRFRCNLYFFHK